VGEISHSYLSWPEAAARIADLTRTCACWSTFVSRSTGLLRLPGPGEEPTQFDGSFPAALERFPRLLDRGRYGDPFAAHLDLFPADQLHVSLFDDLPANAKAYADEV
jgi:hypothetical protein